MTTLELQQWKKNFVEDYLNEIDDLEVLERLKKYVKRIMPKKGTPRPCVVHSKEEMIAAVRASEEDIKHGRILSGEELEKEIETWF